MNITIPNLKCKKCNKIYNREAAYNKHKLLCCDTSGDLPVIEDKLKNPNVTINEAIELCKKHKATLLIAKLDRLARNVSFVSSLMDSKVNFTAVDNPNASNLTIHILSAVAQDEAKTISKRIKSALAQSEKKLGNPQNLTEEARLKAIESIKHKANHNPHNKRALGFVSLMDYKNMKLREVAEALNSNGFVTSTGKQFSTTQVIRLLKKIA